jgi:hypothetical protein
MVLFNDTERDGVGEQRAAQLHASRLAAGEQLRVHLRIDALDCVPGAERDVHAQ